jgi:transposase InsO family protein
LEQHYVLNELRFRGSSVHTKHLPHKCGTGPRREEQVTERRESVLRARHAVADCGTSDTKIVVEGLRRHYDQVRSHSSLGNLTPAELKKTF